MHINRERLKNIEHTQEALEASKEGDKALIAAPRTGTAEEKAPDASKPEAKKRAPKPQKPKGYYAKRLFAALVLVVILAACLFKIYMDNSYRSNSSAEDLDDSFLNIEITDNTLVIRNPTLGETSVKTGLVFYQNLRVEPDSYLLLMQQLANLGYDCFLPTASGNQPYLNVEGAETVIRKYTGVKRWILVSHDAGCTPAAQYAAENPNLVDGLIHLGGFSDIDLSATDLTFLSVLGTEDGIIDTASYEEAKQYAPEGATFLTMRGANNSGFADSVLFKGDRQAQLSPAEQREMTALLIHTFLSKEAS